MANNPFPEMNQAEVAGTKWTRAQRAVIEIPIEGDASVNFILQTAINLDGEIITKDAGNLVLPLTTGNTYPLLDATTGEPTGEITSDDELGAILYSKFMAAMIAQAQA